MNKVYIYDGTFTSLLSLISILIKHNIEPIDIKSEKEYIDNLLDEKIYFNIENKKAELAYLKNAVSMHILYTCNYAFLSNDKSKEINIYYFIKNAFIYKDTIYGRKNIDSVNKVIKLSNMVSREAHKIKGFLRFKKTKNNFYYASINPTHNVIKIVSRQFRERLSIEYWLIKDINRGIYALYDMKEIRYLTDEDIIKLNIDLSDDELDIEKLWLSFFNTIAIKERENLKCQMNFMPKKYWKTLIEMEDMYEESS